jgi:hypothetical protein
LTSVVIQGENLEMHHSLESKFFKSLKHGQGLATDLIIVEETRFTVLRGFLK